MGYREFRCPAKDKVLTAEVKWYATSNFLLFQRLTLLPAITLNPSDLTRHAQVSGSLAGAIWSPRRRTHDTFEGYFRDTVARRWTRWSDNRVRSRCGRGRYGVSSWGTAVE